ncbi:MAG: M16 family metallopeptidase [Vicinamibacterales bacterium]
MAVDRSRLPDVGPDPVFHFPSLVRHRFANGLEVRTVEHHSVPIVTFVLQVDDGSGADPGHQEGLAAITADMLDEGTGALSAIEVSEALARIGAELDIDVAPDVTVFTLTTLTRFADRGAALLSDILAKPSLREEDFARVRQLRLDRLRQLRDVPPAVAERAFLRLLYGDHPYGHLPIGSDASLRALRPDDIRAFHAAAYRPTHATLVVVGDMRHDDLRAAAERAFGGWCETRTPGATGALGETSATGDAGASGVLGAAGAGSAAGARDAAMTPVAARANGTRLAVVPREHAAQSELRIGHLTTGRNTPDYPALLMLNAVLGGPFVSRVNLKLREEKGYTYGARTGFDWRRGVSPFSLQASVHTAVTADAIADSFTELEGIRGGRPVEEREMALARSALTRGYPRSFETAQQVARSVAQLVLYGLPDSYFEEFVPKVKAVTAGEVTRVARTHLHPSRMVTLIVGDHHAIGGSLQALQLGEPVMLSDDP